MNQYRFVKQITKEEYNKKHFLGRHVIYTFSNGEVVSVIFYTKKKARELGTSYRYELLVLGDEGEDKFGNDPEFFNNKKLLNLRLCEIALKSN